MQEHTDLRDTLNEQLDVEKLRSLTKELQSRIENSGRSKPIPKLSDRALLRLEKEQAKRQRIEEQLKEDGVVVTPEVTSVATERAIKGHNQAMTCVSHFNTHDFWHSLEPILCSFQAVEAAMVEDGLVKKGKLPKPYPPVRPSRYLRDLSRQDTGNFGSFQGLFIVLKQL